jgi:RNA polymerase sigma-70 factor, ECF subfamily
MGGEVVYALDRFRRDEESPAAPSDRERFERLLDRHHRRLRRVVCGIVTEPDRVEDVLQEAYLKAYRKLPRAFANEAHESVWLYRVVYRCCIDEVRRMRRNRETPVLELHAAAPSAGSDVLEALATLSVQDRTVVLLVDLVGLGYDEAAEVLHIPRGTVASRLNAARARLREAFDA